jgi:diguanylate cyclase
LNGARFCVTRYDLLPAHSEAVPGNYLVEVLGRTEHVHELIEQSAQALASVSADSRHELANGDTPPGAGKGIDDNEIVTRQLRAAATELTAVIQSLRIEIRARKMVDHQLAAAVEQEEGSRNAALHDSLTGLPNRVLFRDRLQHGIAQAKRHQRILAVMFIDLDNFKTVNDTYGHEAGDAVLQTVATRLKRNTRDADTVSRYGGDEFLYVLNQIRDENDIAMIASKILSAIQAPCSLDVRDVVVNTSMKASIGIAVFPADGLTASALIKSADQAMYRAKESKAGYAFVRPESGPYVRSRTDAWAADE